jgi:hypothetical protein
MPRLARLQAAPNGRRYGFSLQAGKDKKIQKK